MKSWGWINPVVLAALLAALSFQAELLPEALSLLAAAMLWSL
jgi:hypothetical protein